MKPRIIKGNARAYKFPCYPNEAQQAQLDIEFKAARAVYNWALATCSGEYKEHGKSLNYNKLNKRLTLLKQQPDEYWLDDHLGHSSWLQNASSQVEQYALKNLTTAFKNFFRRVAKGENPGHPKFKIKGRSNNSVTYPMIACKYNHERKEFWVPKCATKKFSPLKIKWDRRKLPDSVGDMITTTISRDNIGKYFISFAVDEPVTPLEKHGLIVGVDVGITDVVVTSESYKSGNFKDLLTKIDKRLNQLKRNISFIKWNTSLQLKNTLPQRKNTNIDGFQD